MRDIEQENWIDQLEVTGPIKSIMSFVDELSQNYDRRIAAMHTDYQKDVEEILAAYKQEKEEFQALLQQEKNTIAALDLELKSLQQSYKILSVEHKLAEESLETTKAELAHAIQELKNEEELLNIAQERIRVANEQVKQELEEQEKIEVDAEAIASKGKFGKTREFLKQIMDSRKERTIILRQNEDPEIAEDDDEERDMFSY